MLIKRHSGVDLNQDPPGHEPTSLSKNVVNELGAAFGVGSPHFSQPAAATAPTCCKYHLLNWIAEQLRAGKPITDGDRERVAEALELILQEMRLAGNTGDTESGAVITTATDAQKAIAQILEDVAASDDETEGHGEAVVISLTLPENVRSDDIDLPQILSGLLSKGDELLADMTREVTDVPPHQEASPTPGVSCRPDGVRIVTPQGTLLLPVSRAVEVAGMIVGWISGQEELMHLLAQHVAQARNGQAAPGSHHQPDDAS